MKMKKNDYSAITLVIFLFGAIVVAAALFFIKDLFPDRTGTYIFVCISTVLIYAAAFLPIVMNLSGKTAQIIASGAVYYKGMTVFGLISAADIFLAITMIPLKAAVVIQLAALFIFLIYVFMACVTSDTVNNVGKAEAENRSVISEMRSKAQRLSIMAEKSDNKAIKSAVARMNDDLRYLSPSGSSEAYELECRMSVILDSMLSDTYFRSNGMQSSETIEAKLNDYELLYEQRKNIYYER